MISSSSSATAAAVPVRSSLSAAWVKKLVETSVARHIEALDAESSGAQIRMTGLVKRKAAFVKHITEFATEFVRLVTAEANQTCEKSSEKRPSKIRRLTEVHLQKALLSLGFRKYFNHMKKAATKLNENGEGEEEERAEIKSQKSQKRSLPPNAQEMTTKRKRKFKSKQPKLTDEEAQALAEEQEKMLAAAASKFNSGQP